MVAVTEYLTWEEECFILINICRPQTSQFLALLILGKGRNRLAWQWEQEKTVHFMAHRKQGSKKLGTQNIKSKRLTFSI